MKIEYIIVILLLAIVLLVMTNNKQENARFCKPPGIQLIKDASGNYHKDYCCSNTIDETRVCTCIISGENLDYQSSKEEDCCSKKIDASGNCL